MKLTLCGDLCVTNSTREYFRNLKTAELFGDVIDVFRASDRVIVNLECALIDGGTPIKKMGPNLKGPLNTAKVLKQIGVTDCGLSNNHIFDYGLEGLLSTVDALDKNGIKWTGVGENEADSRKNHIIEMNGKRIAVIAVCEHEYSYALPNRRGARPYDPYDTMEDIREAKKCADFVVVMYHGGKEYCEYPSPRLRKLCRAMARCGADIVLCQHSHCIGCREKYDNCHIVYGQGNFHFVKYLDLDCWSRGLIVQADITDKIDISFLPVVETEHGIRLAAQTEKEKILGGFYERSESLCSDRWLDGWRSYCKTVEEKYKRVITNCSFESGADDYAQQLFRHFYDCEAHSDIWYEILPTWNMTNEVEE